MAVSVKRAVAGMSLINVGAMLGAAAQAIVVACPLCHTNLDMRQRAMRKRYGDLPQIPIYYISELVAFACGAEPKEIGVQKHFVGATETLKG